MKYRLSVKCSYCREWHVVRSFRSLTTLRNYYLKHLKGESASVTDSSGNVISLFVI